MGRRRCVVVGTGWNAAGATGVDAVWRSVLNGSAEPNTPFGIDWPRELGPRMARRLPLAARLALLAGRESLPDWLAPSEHSRVRIALVTTPITTSSIAGRAGANLRRGQLPPASLSSQISGAAAAAAIGRDLGVEGPTFCVEAACASSAVAISQAASLIEASTIGGAVTGGADVQVDLGTEDLDLMQAVFSAMRIIDTSGRASPFSREASGMVSGQGAAFVTLFDERILPAGVLPQAVIAGWATTFEPEAEFASAADGSAVARLIGEALAHADLRPTEVAAVIAHGTGTRANDLAEAAGIREVLGPDVLVTSLKGHLGHAAYAAGSTNIVAACEAIRTAVFPGLRTDSAPDPRYCINLVSGPKEFDPGPIVCIALGLGGFNAAVVVSPP